MRSNQIIESLKISPRTAAELPHKVSTCNMSLANHNLIRMIKPGGRRSKNRSQGHFITIYYLEGDQDQAIQKFIDVNRDILETIDFSHSQRLQSGLSKEISKKIIERCGETLKLYNQKVYKV
jgi:hypothetical protein